jgi:hypothetical protein
MRGEVLAKRLVIRTACAAIALLLLISPWISSVRAAAEPSDWFTKTPELQPRFNISPSLPPYSINGNRDCNKQKIITRPRKILPVYPYVAPEESHDSCVVDTGYGLVSQSGYLLVPGETTFGKVFYPWGSPMTLLPVPQSSHAIYLEANPPNGTSLIMIRNFLSAIEGQTLSTGAIEYRVKSGTDIWPLNDSGGNRLAVRIDSISFSSNGAWMVADIFNVGLTRLSTSDFAARQVFDVPFNYSSGVDPGAQTAITSLGRYVVVGSRNFTRLGLYDLESCPTSTACQRLDLWKYFKDTVPGFDGAVRFRLGSDYVLRMYTITRPNGVLSVERTALVAGGHEPKGFEYLALGDSFASGEGAYQYKALTDSGDNKCHLSLRSYPYLIANELGFNEMGSIACSGAKIYDVNTAKDFYEKPQAVGKENNSFDSQIYTSFEPGYRPQLDFVRINSPEAITISTFGNDIGFGNKIKRCLEPDTCYATYEDRLEIIRQINSQFDRLTGMYTHIKEEMEGKKVYVLGYPSLAADGGNCALNVRLNADEIVFSNQLVSYLNAVIKAAADKIGFYYVDVEDAFANHRLCEAQSSAIAVNGLTSGNDFVNIPFTDFDGPIANESFHPNALGHELYAKTILEKTDNLTKPMPAPNQTAAPPAESDGIALLLDTPKTNRQLNRVNYDDDLGNDVALRESWWLGTIKTTTVALKAASPFSVWLHSDPVKLGDFTTSQSGESTFSVQIPAGTPAGFHTIHVYATSLSGEPVNIQKVIYVAYEEEDTDGDGVLNNAETCGLGPATGVDEDKDGIDDACDGYIGDPPPEPEENNTPASSEDPKPPENNPETVAGDEQLRDDESAPQILSAQSSATYAASPYELPFSDSSTPQVAAETDEKPPEPVSDSDTQTKPSVKIGIPADEPAYWLLFVFLAAVTFVAGVLYQRNKR